MGAPRGGGHVWAAFTGTFGARCRPNRDSGPAIKRAGFDIIDLHRYDLPGPLGVPIPHIAGAAARRTVSKGQNGMTSAATVLEVPTAGRYRIDPEQSTISFRTRHIFGLAPVSGTFRLREGHLHIADPVTASTARATVAARSFHTGLSTRDRMVKSGQYLDVERYPDITFVSIGLTQVDQQWTLHGTLTVCGNGGPLEVRVDEVRADGPHLRVRATSRVDRYAFGVTAMRGMTGRWLTFRLDLVATPQDSMA